MIPNENKKNKIALFPFSHHFHFKGKRLFILCCLLVNSFFSKANITNDLELIAQRLDKVLMEDWKITIQENQIRIQFNRWPFLQNFSDSAKHGEYLYQSREYTSENLTDSVWFYSIVGLKRNLHADSVKIANALKSHPFGKSKLEIVIWLEPMWSKKKLEKCRIENLKALEKLKLKDSHIRASSVYEDMRIRIPDMKRYPDVEASFYRLPFQSPLTKNAVFIDADLPCLWCGIIYENKNDSLFYLKKANDITTYYKKTVNQIGNALFIQDFNYE